MSVNTDYWGDIKFELVVTGVFNHMLWVYCFLRKKFLCTVSIFSHIDHNGNDRLIWPWRGDGKNTTFEFKLVNILFNFIAFFDHWNRNQRFYEWKHLLALNRSDVIFLWSIHRTSIHLHFFSLTFWRRDQKLLYILLSYLPSVSHQWLCLNGQ